MPRYAVVVIVLLAFMAGCSPKSLVAVTKEGDLDGVKKLMETRASEYSDTEKCVSMIWAADQGHMDIVKYLAGRGVDLNCSAGGGWTPLLRASASDQMDVLKYLVEHGAAVEVKTLFGATPLSSAAERGHGDVVRFLLVKGADLDGAIVYLKGQLREDPKNREAKTGIVLLENYKKQLSGKNTP